MKALIQRVKRASVSIENELFSKIDKGILVFVGVDKSDDETNAEKLAEKILKLRIFEDENEKMNLSVSDVNGDILAVSQFTLCADCKKGTRPSFDNSAPLEKANKLYEYFTNCLRQSGLKTETGKFRADMDVELVNDGPVTLWVEK